MDQRMDLFSDQSEGQQSVTDISSSPSLGQSNETRAMAMEAATMLMEALNTPRRVPTSQPTPPPGDPTSDFRPQDLDRFVQKFRSIITSREASQPEPQPAWVAANTAAVSANDVFPVEDSRHLGYKQMLEDAKAVMRQQNDTLDEYKSDLAFHELKIREQMDKISQISQENKELLEKVHELSEAAAKVKVLELHIENYQTQARNLRREYQLCDVERKRADLKYVESHQKLAEKTEEVDRLDKELDNAKNIIRVKDNELLKAIADKKELQKQLFEANIHLEDTSASYGEVAELCMAQFDKIMTVLHGQTPKKKT